MKVLAFVPFNLKSNWCIMILAEDYQPHPFSNGIRSLDIPLGSKLFSTSSVLPLFCSPLPCLFLVLKPFVPYPLHNSILEFVGLSFSPRSKSCCWFRLYYFFAYVDPTFHHHVSSSVCILYPHKTLIQIAYLNELILFYPNSKYGKFYIYGEYQIFF